MADAPSTTWDTVTVVVATAAVTGLVTHTLPLSDPNVVGWRAWYDDGVNPYTVVDSTQTAWALAPTANLQVVMIYLNKTWDGAGTKPYRLISQGADVVQDDAAISPVSKTGKLLDDATYEQIVADAMAAELAPVAAGT